MVWDMNVIDRMEKEDVGFFFVYGIYVRFVYRGIDICF